MRENIFLDQSSGAETTELPIHDDQGIIGKENK
jgi:hypothetical protein